MRIETADISNKFKFFETYRSETGERKQFRITPPRDGVVRAESPDANSTDGNVYIDPDIVRSGTGRDDEVAVVAALQNSHTTTKMLNMFRQMEEEAIQEPVHRDLKPLKRFTPPPSSDQLGSQRNARRSTSNTTDDYTDDSEDDSSEDSDEEESNDEHEPDNKNVDEFLLQAQSAARAKQLRAKFERWESKEILREKNNGSSVLLYDGENQSQVETAKE